MFLEPNHSCRTALLKISSRSFSGPHNVQKKNPAARAGLVANRPKPEGYMAQPSNYMWMSEKQMQSLHRVNGVLNMIVARKR